jgi:hypothetical protein
LKQHCALLEKAVQLLEKRFTVRVLRTIPSIRKRCNASILKKACETMLAAGTIFFFVSI